MIFCYICTHIEQKERKKEKANLSPTLLTISFLINKHKSGGQYHKIQHAFTKLEICFDSFYYIFTDLYLIPFPIPPWKTWYVEQKMDYKLTSLSLEINIWK